MDDLTHLAPTCAWEDDLSPADRKRYLAFPFTVPPDTAALQIDLHYEPPQVDGLLNILGLTLLDPGGFRGALLNGHNDKRIAIGPAGATPGMRPGPLPAGRWLIELDTFSVLPGLPCAFRLEVRLCPGPRLRLCSDDLRSSSPCLCSNDFSRSFSVLAEDEDERVKSLLHGRAEDERKSSLRRRRRRQRPGWCLGDLHTHTHYSDGWMSAAELVSAARRHGLSFIALTDHNSVAGLADPALQSAQGPLVLPGQELTTYHGHALAWGVTAWVDWRTGLGGRTMAGALDEVHAAGGLLAAAHVGGMGDPHCSGCAWRYANLMPGALDAVEIWNGVWEEPVSANDNSLRIWRHWLGQGLRVPATAGSDAHSYLQYGRRPGLSRVYARELSVEGVLEAVARGHVMLTSGPGLYLEAGLRAGGRAMMGDAVPAEDVATVTLRTAEAPAGSILHALVDGEEAQAWPAQDNTEVSLPVLPGAHSLHAELRAGDGRMLAITNPIYIVSSM